MSGTPTEVEAKLAEIRAGLVKPLEWSKPEPGWTMTRAETIIGVALVWTHHEAEGRWFWKLGDIASGTEANEAACKKMLWLTYEHRILSALDLSYVESLKAERDQAVGETVKAVTLLRKRERQIKATNAFWLRAAKAAVVGDTRELWNRIALSEADPVDVVLSDAPPAAGATDA